MDGSFVPRKKKKKDTSDDENSGEEKEEKKPRGKKRKAEEVEVKEEKRPQPRSRAQAPPNKTLFIQNLPEDCTDTMLISLFQQFQGFLEVRLVSAKRVAFVEFQNELQSGAAMAEYQGYRLTHDHAMQISFQKRM